MTKLYTIGKHGEALTQIEAATARDAFVKFTGTDDPALLEQRRLDEGDTLTIADEVGGPASVHTAADLHPFKTDAEIEALMASWEHDPIWDVEYTESFEAYRDRLKALSDARKLEWERESQERELHGIRNLMQRHGVPEAYARLIWQAQNRRSHYQGRAESIVTHLFRNAGLNYVDLHADVGSFVGDIANFAQVEAEIAVYRALGKIEQAKLEAEG